MAYFNEENTVEQMLINAAGKCGWIYVEQQEVPRLPDEVLVTEWLVTTPTERHYRRPGCTGDLSASCSLQHRYKS